MKHNYPWKKLKKCIFSKMQVCTCLYYKRNINYINLYTCIISTHLTGRYWTIGYVTFGQNDNRTQSPFFEQNMAAVKTAGADYLESLPNTIIKCLCIYLYVCMHLNMYMCHYLYIVQIYSSNSNDNKSNDINNHNNNNIYICTISKHRH